MQRIPGDWGALRILEKFSSSDRTIPWFNIEVIYNRKRLHSTLGYHTHSEVLTHSYSADFAAQSDQKRMENCPGFLTQPKSCNVHLDKGTPPDWLSTPVNDNHIHPTAIIDDRVSMGSRNVIGPNVIIIGKVEIGDFNWIGPNVIIGTAPEIRGKQIGKPWAGQSGAHNQFGVSIGNSNVIREFSTIHSGSARETVIQHECYLLRNSHVAHDCLVGSQVTMSCNATVGGHAEIAPFANLGMNSAVHQRTKIGAGSMVGMGSIVRNDLAPFALTIGNPARVIGLNERAIDKFGVSFLLDKKGEKFSNEDLVEIPEMRRSIESWITLLSVN